MQKYPKINESGQKHTLIYLHPHFTLSGGAGRFVLETAKEMKRLGYRVVIISITTNPQIIAGFEDVAEFENIGGFLSSSIFFWLLFPLSVYRVWAKVRVYEPFILFAQVFPANWWGFVLKMLNPQIKLLWMCQEPSAFIHSKEWLKAIRPRYMQIIARVLNPFLKVIDVYWARKTDVILVNSHFTAQSAVRAYGFKTQDLVVCYPGTDVQKFKPSAISPLKRENRILAIGRMSAFKRFEISIEAMALLKKQTQVSGKVLPQLVFIGAGECLAELQKRVQKLELADCVQFAGAVSDAELIQYLHTSKVLVVNAINEAFGLTPVEGMAAGLVCVVPDSGGPLETVVPEITGFVVKGGSASELARILKYIFEQDEKFSFWSEQAQKRAQNFSLQMSAQIIDQTIRQKWP